MPPNPAVTRFSSGFSNMSVGTILENYKDSNLARYNRIFDDFNNYTAANWLATSTGAATQAVTAGDGGQLLMTNTAANNDITFIQWAGGTGAAFPTFLFEATKDMVFACSVAVDSALNSGLILGLSVFQATPFPTPATGMFITKSIGSTTPQGLIQNASAGSSAFQTQTPMVDGAFMDFAIVYGAYNGVCTMYMGTPGVNITQASQFRLNPVPPTLPVAACAPIIGLQNGTAAAHTLKVDWVLAAKSRVPG